MVNYMREHVPQETRIHYIITNGGAAPNIVPEFAESYYYVRHPDPRVTGELFERVVKAAEGAAIGTGTTMDYELISGTYSTLPNDALGRAMDANLHRVGAPNGPRTRCRLPRSCARTCPARTFRRPPAPAKSTRINTTDEVFLDRLRRRELGDAARHAEHCDLGAGHRGAQLAGGGGGRHRHRHQVTLVAARPSRSPARSCSRTPPWSPPPRPSSRGAAAPTSSTNP